MTLALIDGDIVVWRAAAGVERTMDWEDGDGPTASADPDKARERAINIVREWTKAARCDKPIVCLSDLHRNWRKSICPLYKAKRGPEKPVAFHAAREALVQAFTVFDIPALEADDVMGILHTSAKYADSVIVSMDKDMQTIPGTHYQPGKSVAPFRVGPVKADYNWMRQTLMGDRVDEIVGIPGVGPVNAERILAQSGSTSLSGMWRAVVAAYQERGLTWDDAIHNARLTRILRRSDFNLKDQEITLWHPIAPATLKLQSVLGRPAPATPTAPSPPSSPPPSAPLAKPTPGPTPSSSRTTTPDTSSSRSPSSTPTASRSTSATSLNTPAATTPRTASRTSERRSGISKSKSSASGAGRRVTTSSTG